MRPTNLPPTDEEVKLNIIPQEEILKTLIKECLARGTWTLNKQDISSVVSETKLRKMCKHPILSLLITDGGTTITLNEELICNHTLVVDDDEAWNMKWLLTYHRRKYKYILGGRTEADAAKKAKQATSRAANKRHQRINKTDNSKRRATRVTTRASRLQHMTPEEIRSLDLDDYLDALADPVGGNYKSYHERRKLNG